MSLIRLMLRKGAGVEMQLESRLLDGFEHQAENFLLDFLEQVTESRGSFLSWATTGSELSFGRMWREPQSGTLQEGWLGDLGDHPVK